MKVRSVPALCTALLFAIAGCSGSGDGPSPDAALVQDGGAPIDGGSLADGGLADGGTEDGGTGSDGGEADGGLEDGGATSDGGEADGGVADGGAEDGGAPAVPLPGFGSISGDCGELDDQEWSSSSSFYFRSAIDLGTAAFDVTALSPGGQEIVDGGNLGGSSLHSEVFAYEVLYRCELALLLKTEGAIRYLDGGTKKTDLLTRIDGRKVGVSVTRAFHFPAGQPYTVDEAVNLLTKKLGDIAISAAFAHPDDAWERSILSVIAYDAQHADTLMTAYLSLDASLTANVILYVTVTDGNDEYVY